MTHDKQKNTTSSSLLKIEKGESDRERSVLTPVME
jgi:hypothetical protein